MLSSLIWLPIFGTLIICFLPSFKNTLIYRNLALIIALITLVINIIIASNFDISLYDTQFGENFSWLGWLGLGYDLGIDGLSLPLISLNSLLSLIAIYISPKDIQRPRFYYGMILLLTGGVAGAFLAQNLLLFFLFYEVEIVPLYFLIAVWGGWKKRLCGNEIFTLYRFIGIPRLSILLRFSMV